jgi:5-methyltetrahydropteroyltriglutamate--homocysteine methyltransferase
LTARATPPFRAEHVGSLLRPPELLAARAALAAGHLDPAAFRSIEDDAVHAAVAMQERIGLRSITDGEYPRRAWQMDFIFAIDGIERAEEEFAVEFHNAEGALEFTSSAIRVAGRVALTETIFGEAFARLRDCVNVGTPKLTIPSPSMVHYWGGHAVLDPDVYADAEAFWRDLTAVYADEVRGLRELGCTYLQLDDTSLSYLNDPRQREHVRRSGGDPDRQHLEYIEHLNTALAGRPPDMAVTVHTCRGNYRSSWIAEGGYDFVAEALFNDLQVDGFFLEYDDARSGSFAPLRFVPADRFVVLGLITTKHGELDDRDTIRRRIDEASRYVPLEQLCLSPQCGFSSTADGNTLTYEQQIAKLALVVEIADEVWGR